LNQAWQSSSIWRKWRKRKPAEASKTGGGQSKAEETIRAFAGPLEIVPGSGIS